MHIAGQRTVSFIANLLPLYTHEISGTLAGARSLRDGTLVLPCIYDDEESAPEEEWVSVCWQGDTSRKTTIQGWLYASNAVIDFVTFHSVGKDTEYAKNLLKQITEHYEFKTSESLYVPYLDEEKPLWMKVLDQAESYWPEAIWNLIKKGALGLP